VLHINMVKGDYIYNEWEEEDLRKMKEKIKELKELGYKQVYYDMDYLNRYFYFEIDEEEVFEKWEQDEIGFYKKGAGLKATGADARREKRPNMWFPVFVTNDDNVYVSQNPENSEEVPMEIRDKEFIKVYPITNGQEMRWRWNRDKFNKDANDVIVIRNRDNITLYKKQRPQLGDMPTKKPKTIFYKPEYSSGNGTGLLKDIFNDEKVFNNPKPLELIKDIIKLGSDKNDIILDFFAGSGTTGHAVLDINKEEPESNRKFILVTNNEQNICEEVCYPRMKKLLKGYINQKGKRINRYEENLKYFKADVVNKNKNRDQMKAIMAQKIYDLLCIKENCFTLIEEKPYYRIYSQGNKIMGIYSFFSENYMEEFKEKIKQVKVKEKIIYSFSFTNYVKEGLFEDLKGVELKAIPTRILEILDDLRK